MNSILEDLYPDKDVLARRQIAGLDPLPKTGDVLVEYLHEEMRQCFLNGHDHAALVTSCALLEAAIKMGLYFEALVEASYEFDSIAWDRIDKMAFGEVINAAKGQGIIAKENWKKLEWFRNNIRNYYMHGQTPDWVKNTACTFIKGDLSSESAQKVTVEARQELWMQRPARVCADRDVCDNMIRFVDAAVRDLQSRAARAEAEWHAQNVTVKPTAEQFQKVFSEMKKRANEE